MKQLQAALIFFTRIPFWRIWDVPSAYFKRVVEFWPLIGWLTGGVTAGVLWLAAQVLPFPTAVIIAFTARLLLTGALHEDGMADFLDGMGGGTSRSRILEIMKDSHIGTYGVIGLVVYYLLLFSLIIALPDVATACVVIFAADTWSKCCAAQIINFLPYARKEEEAKNKTVYTRMKPGGFALCFIAGAAPLVLFPLQVLPAALFPLVTTFCLILYMRKRIGGYTGDCCGATFLLSELSFFLGTVLLIYHRC